MPLKAGQGSIDQPMPGPEVEHSILKSTTENLKGPISQKLEMQ